MRRGLLLLALLAAAGPLRAAPVDPYGGRPFRVVATDPGMHALVAPDAKLESWGDDYGLTEGPLWVDEGRDGYLLFSDVISNVIYKRTRDGRTTVFLDRAGADSDDLHNTGLPVFRGRMAVILIGPNGLTLDREGRVVYCAPNDRAVMRLEKDGRRTVLADRVDGKRFSGPNDVVLRSDGTLYFTDSRTGLRDGNADHDRQVPTSGVYRVKNKRAILIADDGGVPDLWPNGIAFTPDEKQMYLNFGFKKILRYDVRPDGSITNPKPFLIGEGSDGIKVDTLGNVYTTSGMMGAGEVRITSPAGKRLGTIELPTVAGEPETPVCATNIAFGDPDGKGLFITACQHVYHIRLKVAGIRARAAG
jgi:gluconolactonase